MSGLVATRAVLPAALEPPRIGVMEEAEREVMIGRLLSTSREQVRRFHAAATTAVLARSPEFICLRDGYRLKKSPSPAATPR